MKEIVLEESNGRREINVRVDIDGDLEIECTIPDSRSCCFSADTDHYIYLPKLSALALAKFILDNFLKGG